mgnify:FL=1
MTVKISFYDGVFSGECTVYEAESVGHWILDNKSKLVNFAVFDGQPSLETDITKDVQKLIATDGDYVVLSSPAGALDVLFPFWSLSVRSIDYLAKQLIPTPTLPNNINRSQQSPNNALAGRTNEPRILQRIEDIFGTVRSYPSLLQPVYSKYINNTQYEYSYMCIGRGWYDIDDVRDGDSLVSDVTGASAEFYNPFTSPNSGSPFLTIGGGISEPVRLVKKSNNVDGQTLQARNQFTLITNTDFIDFYEASASPVTVGDKIGGMSNELYDNLTIGGDLIVTGSTGYDGTYTVSNKLGLGTNVIELTTSTFSSTATSTATLTSTTSEPEYTSWVTLKDADMTQIWINIVAQQGLFYENGDGKLTLTVNFEIDYQKLVAGTYAPTGSIYTHSDTISGVDSNLKGKTIEIITGWTGATRVRARRTSNHDFGFSGSVVDEIKYESLSAVSELSVTDFGNVTTVQTLTKATTRAIALKERKFNCIAGRRIPTYNGTVFSGEFNNDGSISSGTISATNNPPDIIAAISKDKTIGNLDINIDVDMPQIYQTWYSNINNESWTGGVENLEFSYTLDSDNISFEETVRMIADACFCVAYRQNGKIRFSFDGLQSASSALFTHRNKKPASDVISRRFAADDQYDGIEFVYNDSVSDAQETIKLPLDLSATNYKKIELAGVRNYTQAWYRANREYNKLKLQRVSIETETTSDGRLLLPNQRIDIVDNTRFDSQDGEVIAQDGLILTLSRNVTFGVGTHSILLIKRDGSLESIGVTAGTSANKVVLAYAPSEAINTVNGGAIGIRTIFSFGADSADGANSYLVQEVNISDNSYVKVTAINYDAGYYAADSEAAPNREDIL